MTVWDPLRGIGLTIFLMWAAFLIVLAHIICRYIFVYPLYFAEEISRYAFHLRNHDRGERGFAAAGLTYQGGILSSISCLVRGRYFLNGLMGLVIIYFSRSIWFTTEHT